MDRMTAALAGLLHDIGKFWQRAESSPDQRLAPGYEGFAADDYGKHGAHATWSAAFIQDYVPAAFPGVGAAALYHHRPQDRLSKLVALADRLAAGERADVGTAQPRNLLSIFCQIRPDRQPAPEKAYFPLRPLALEAETLFPAAQQTDSAAAYTALWDGFTREAQALRDQDDPETYLESLYHLLYRYTWCVPAAFYRSTPDISLFDHSRVTAALAACLADRSEDELDQLLAHADDKKTPNTLVAYLVEGDISGVQRFLYTLTSKGAAKGLRGRSFYLQLLNEAIARYILRRLGLPITNLIYVGGGHFYLLIPPTARDNLKEVQQYLDKLLLAHHEGTLYLALGAAELRAADFQVGAFSAKWREAGRAVGAAKRRRFADLPEETLVEQVFAPRGHGGNEETECQVCHAEREEFVTDDEGTRKCLLCASFEELGQKLGQAEALVWGYLPPAPPQQPGEWTAVLAELGIAVGLVRSDGTWARELEPVTLERAVVLGMRGFPAPRLAAQIARDLGCPVAAGTRYTVAVTPRKGYEVATFEDFQEAARGTKRLGVLRMDVDNLGYLFKQGLQADGKSLATLARVASLSGMLSLFFEGWVGTLCQQLNRDNRREIRVIDERTGERAWVDTDVIYAIYSGGDDLFIVGAWDLLPGLANEIRSDLGRFASVNPAVHVSGGITLHGGKYPLYLAADDAHHALDDAKDLPDKNALSFLGRTFSWADYDAIARLRAELEELVAAPSIGRSLLRLLLQADAAVMQGSKGHTRAGRPQAVYGPWVWRSAYMLTRLAERAGTAYKPRVEALRDSLIDQIGIVGVAARWAEALTKPEASEEGS